MRKKWAILGFGLTLTALLMVLGLFSTGAEASPRQAETVRIDSSYSSSIAVTGAVETTTIPFVVVIDAGHQSVKNTKKEPIGPGSKLRKAAVATGARGKYTHIPEYRINLLVALKLQNALESKGITVVMVRTKNKVNITNSERAEIANAASADLFIRLHCDSSKDSGIHGISVLSPTKNKWTSSIVNSSLIASKFIDREVIAATGARNRGIVKRSDLTGFNWSKVPTTLVEMGFMSNRGEDKLLASDAYQNKLAAGLAAGTMAYLLSTAQN
jgi:N-acetylmuramoyl-L-alanine amidase